MSEKETRRSSSRENRFSVRLTKLIAAGVLATSMVPAAALADEAETSLGEGSLAAGAYDAAQGTGAAGANTGVLAGADADAAGAGSATAGAADAAASADAAGEQVEGEGAGGAAASQVDFARKSATATVQALASDINVLGIDAQANNAESAVAQIGETTYATLDAAVAAAEDGATIKVLSDCATDGLNLSKNLTIEGFGENKPTVTFSKYGIALWGKALTFRNCNVVMNGIGSTPYTGEWNWMTICASKNASLSLDKATMIMDGANAGNKHAIYFCSNNKLNLTNGSLLEIKNYQQDALEWDGGDGGYNVNIADSAFVSSRNRSGFTGTFYATIDNSTVEVTESTGNGSNGTYYTIKNGSKVLFEGNRNWGISAWRIDMSQDSSLKAINNGYSGIWTRVLNIDGTCSLDAEGNGSNAPSFSTNAGIFFQGNATYASTIEDGADVVIKNNAGSGIYTAQRVCDLTIDAAAVITNNGIGLNNISNQVGATYGGGIYNVGTMRLGSNVVVYNNHASAAGDDIYSTDKLITFPVVGESWYLDGEPDCEDLIDGWYDDSNPEENGKRWEAHAGAEGSNHVVLTEPAEGDMNGTITLSATAASPVALKAAHGVYGVSYEFVSGTQGMDLPDKVLALLPSDEGQYAPGATVKALQPDQASVRVESGTWTFVGYDPGDEQSIDGDILFTGTWVYEADPVVAPTDPESSDPEPTESEEAIKPTPLAQTGDELGLSAAAAAVAAGAASVVAVAAARSRKRNMR